MGTVALLPSDCRSRAQYLGNRELPDNYMADFTLMGFVVGQYQAALTLLRAEGFGLDEQLGGAEVSVDSPTEILAIKDLLAANGISCEFADVADTIYQA